MDPSPAKITISDVARAANVAQSTVSLVLNQRGRVSEATRQRVRSVMADLGYVPRRNASRPNRHVAVVYSRELVLCSELVRYCREWIGGIREALGEGESTDISIFCGQAHVSEDPMFRATLEEGAVNGVILMGVFPYDGYLQRIQAAGLPVVVLNQVPEMTEFSSVCVDHASAGRLVIQHFAALGHQRIACFFRRDSVSWGRIFGGIRKEIERQDMVLAMDDLSDDLEPPKGDSVFNDPHYFQHIAHQIQSHGVTAVFGGDPFMFRLGTVFEELGVQVPGDISLVGFDNLGLRIRGRKQLCSVDYDTVEMGRLAGKILIQLWQQSGEISNCVMHVPVRLYPGQTTGPCPEGGEMAVAPPVPTVLGRARRRVPVVPGRLALVTGE